MIDELELLKNELQHVRGTLPSRIDVDADGVEKGLAQLVLTLVEFSQIGLNWWRYDRSLVTQDATETTITRLENRIVELERQLARTSSAPPSSIPPRPSRKR